MPNGTHYLECLVNDEQQQQQQQQQWEIVYIALTLFISSLSALIASFLGLRQRRRQRSSSTPSLAAEI